MKSVDAHLAEILATVRPLAPLELELEQALGTTLAEDVTSPVPLKYVFDRPRAEISAAARSALISSDVAARSGVIGSCGMGLGDERRAHARLPRHRVGRAVA